MNYDGNIIDKMSPIIIISQDKILGQSKKTFPLTHSEQQWWPSRCPPEYLHTESGHCGAIWFAKGERGHQRHDLPQCGHEAQRHTSLELIEEAQSKIYQLVKGSQFQDTGFDNAKHILFPFVFFIVFYTWTRVLNFNRN